MPIYASGGISVFVDKYADDSERVNASIKVRRGLLEDTPVVLILGQHIIQLGEKQAERICDLLSAELADIGVERDKRKHVALSEAADFVRPMGVDRG